MRLKYCKVHTPHTHTHTKACRRVPCVQDLKSLDGPLSGRELGQGGSATGAEGRGKRSEGQVCLEMLIRGRQRSSAAPRTETALSRWLLCDLAETGSSCGQRWAPLRLTRTQQGREGICMRGIIWPTNSGPARIPDLTSPFSPGQKYSFKKQTKPEWWL